MSEPQAASNYGNFKEILKQYLTFSNDAFELKQQVAEIQEEINQLVADKKVEQAEIKEQIQEANSKMAALEPFIMDFMKKEDMFEINTNLGRIKYKETNTKKRITKEIIKERVEKIFAGHEKKAELIDMIFNKEEREVKAGLKCQLQVAEDE